MSSALKLAAAVGGASAPLYVDDVFSTYLYTGNGSTQTINNGIDLAGKGGLVWTKRRDSALDHFLSDTVRGATNILSPNSTAASTVGTRIQSFLSNGFTGTYNAGGSFTSWTFRKAPKFFDVVTYTGNGVAGRAIPHSLGVKPGMMIVKATNTTKDWYVWHRSLSSETTSYLVLNSTAAVVSYNLWNTAPDSTNFYLANTTDCNGVGISYVAYLFAHDPSADGIIQCGSFTADASSNATVTLGWEPQYLLIKNSQTAENWYIVDSVRGFTNKGLDSFVYPNMSSAEIAGNIGTPTSTGFAATLSASSTFIYLAIRRPNKPPTTGTQVYNAIARTGTGAAATVTGVGFAPDISITQQRTAVQGNVWYDRLRGNMYFLNSTATGAEGTNAQGVTSFNMDGVSLGTEGSVNGALPIINWFFKRAPGVFDVVCYTGTTEEAAFNHNLTVAPEFIIQKARSSGSGSNIDWQAHHPASASYGFLNKSAGFIGGMGSYAPTSTTFKDINALSDQIRVAYLFATKAGISKVGSYPGNGSSQTINCGFTTGARFILIKRTDSTGDWYVWDYARGIIADNDPHLSLNTTAAEVTTDDSVDPNNSGFIVNQVAATNINVNAATYIFLAIS